MTCEIGRRDERQGAPFSHMAIQEYCVYLESAGSPGSLTLNFVSKMIERKVIFRKRKVVEKDAWIDR